MVHRCGLFHSTRYRWGNGLTPYGASVFISGIQTIGPMIPTFITGVPGVNVQQPPADNPTPSDLSTENEENRSGKFRAGETDWREEYTKELAAARKTQETLTALLEKYGAPDTTKVETDAPAASETKPRQAPTKQPVEPRQQRVKSPVQK
jgi:hypothetical protein